MWPTAKLLLVGAHLIAKRKSIDTLDEEKKRMLCFLGGRLLTSDVSSSTWIHSFYLKSSCKISAFVVTGLWVVWHFFPRLWHRVTRERILPRDCDSHSRRPRALVSLSRTKYHSMSRTEYHSMLVDNALLLYCSNMFELMKVKGWVNLLS